MTAIVFHLHGKSADSDGVTIDVHSSDTLPQLRKTVAEKFSVALPSTISFHVSAAAETLPSDLKPLDTIESILTEHKVSILISGKKVCSRLRFVTQSTLKLYNS